MFFFVCMFADSAVQHFAAAYLVSFLCCVFLFCLSFYCVFLVYSMLSVSLDYQLSVFSNVYFVRVQVYYNGELLVIMHCCLF